MPGRERVGQKNKLTYRWARKGSRPRATHDQRTQSTYLFGAVCPERGAGAALVLPACNGGAMQLHLDEIATKVTPGAHAIVLLDQAGWHGGKVPKSRAIFRSCRCRPAHPNPTARKTSGDMNRTGSEPGLRILRRYRRSLLYAWNTLIDQPWKIMSVARRESATVDD